MAELKACDRPEVRRRLLVAGLWTLLLTIRKYDLPKESVMELLREVATAEEQAAIIELGRGLEAGQAGAEGIANMEPEAGPHDEDEDDWELCPECCHPRAAAMLKEPFFWDCTDELSPFGNDVGADVLDEYRAWRQENHEETAASFMGWLENEYPSDAVYDQLDSDLSPNDDVDVEVILVDEHDNALIALALAQVVIDGTLEAGVAELALVAIERQDSEEALSRWPGFESERSRRLEIIRKAFSEA